MPTEVDPIVGNWYCHLDKGQRFFVVAVDRDERIVEIQHFDGDIDEMELETWYRSDLDLCEAPENWSGPLDIDSPEDLGSDNVTDTSASDWNAPLSEFESKVENEEE